VRLKRLLVILLAGAAILLVPFVAMQFTREVQWTVADFLLAAILVLGAGLSFEFFLRKPTTRARVFVGLVFVAALGLIWLELAVGIFGSPWAGS
jgi:hypothetical protein